MITEDDARVPQAVHLTGIHVPFWSVVGFMVKWSLASIPALFILSLIGFLFSALFLGLALYVGVVFHVSDYLRAFVPYLVPGAQ